MKKNQKNQKALAATTIDTAITTTIMKPDLPVLGSPTVTVDALLTAGLMTAIVKEQEDFAKSILNEVLAKWKMSSTHNYSLRLDRFVLLLEELIDAGYQDAPEFHKGHFDVVFVKSPNPGDSYGFRLYYKGDGQTYGEARFVDPLTVPEDHNPRMKQLKQLHACVATVAKNQVYRADKHKTIA